MRQEIVRRLEGGEMEVGLGIGAQPSAAAEGVVYPKRVRRRVGTEGTAVA